MGRNKLTKDNIDQLRQAYKDGVLVSDLAAKYGIHSTTVNYHLGKDPNSTRPLVERSGEKTLPVVKRKYVKKDVTPLVQPETPTKPMIALVGTSQEIVKTLKELFS